jgi:hypothetical protein
VTITFLQHCRDRLFFLFRDAFAWRLSLLQKNCDDFFGWILLSFLLVDTELVIMGPKIKALSSRSMCIKYRSSVGDSDSEIISEAEEYFLFPGEKKDENNKILDSYLI